MSSGREKRARSRSEDDPAGRERNAGAAAFHVRGSRDCDGDSDAEQYETRPARDEPSRARFRFVAEYVGARNERDANDYGCESGGGKGMPDAPRDERASVHSELERVRALRQRERA